MKAAKSLRIARWLLGILLLPVLGYLIGANLFLRFGLPWVFSSTNSVNASVRSAWTVWPGVFHVRGARVVFQDHNLQWSLDLDQVRIRLRLRELVGKTFHATEVVGAGTVFRMRHRIEPGSKDEPWVKALPPIPEFPAPAVFEARVPEPPVSDAEYALWTVHLENVDVGVREIWAHFIRYQGDRGGGRARGAFRLRPARTLWVNPASLTLDAGRITLGNEQLASALSGKITCTVHPFDVRVPNGREALRFISTGLELNGQGVTPDPVLRQLLPDSGLSLDTTPGTMKLSARMQRGKFSENSLFSLESAQIRATYRDFRLDARQVVARAASEPGDRAETSLRFATAELAALTVPARPAEIRGAFAASVISGLDAAGEASELNRRLELEDVAIPDARLLNAVGDQVRFASGAIGLSLRATEQQGTLEGTGEARLQELRIASGRSEARLDGKLVATLLDARPSEGSGRATVDVELTPSLIRTSNEREGGLIFSEAGKLQLKVEMQRDRQAQIRSQVQLTSSNLSVVEVGATSRREVARMGRLRLDGTLNRSSDGILDADLKGQSSEVRALVGSTWLRARSKFAVKLSRFDAARESGHLASELVVSEGVAVSEGGSDCPWATLPDARLKVDLGFTRASALATVSATLARAHLTWGDFQARGQAELSARLSALDRRRGVGSLSFSTRATGVTLKSGVSARDGWDAEIPSLVLSGELSSDSKVSGTLALSAPGAEARIGNTKMQTDFSALTSLSAVDFKRQEARFSGKFSVSNASLAAGRERIEGWWANISADSALVIARDNVDLSVPFHAELRDGQPGMAMLAAAGSLPSLIADALPLRQLAVVGTIQRKCRLTNFRFTQASGGPLVGRGLLNSTSDAVRGAFLVRLASLQAVSAGVELNASETGVSLLAGDDWLRDRTLALEDMVKNTLAQPCTTPPAECSGEGDSEEPSPVSSGPSSPPPSRLATSLE